MKVRFLFFVLMLILVSETVFSRMYLPAKISQVKNVIIMIPDGMSVGATTLARWYLGEDLAMDEIACGLVRTYSSDAVIADSAPAATAYATGYKAQTGNIAVLPEKVGMPGVKAPEDTKLLSPVATVLEAARLRGKATGIIATSEIMHATPASFSAHDISRSAYDNLSEQQVYSQIDVILGGGYKFFLPENRKDKENLIEEIKKYYTLVTNTEELKNTKANKVFGLFAEAALAYDIDRNPTNEPSLAEMTAKAIEILNRNKNGFFLMVEGSKIDWAAHANEPIALISDIIAFDKAVKVALDFAKKDSNTVVIVLSDHGNSGITIGNRDTTSTYDKIALKEILDPLKKAKNTLEFAFSKINPDKSNVKEVIKEFYGIELNDSQINEIKNAKSQYDAMAVVSGIMAKNAKLGFTTGGHTGEDVVLYVFHPKVNERLTGVVENTDIALYTAMLLGLNLSNATATLFKEAAVELAMLGANVKYDYSDKENPVLIATKGKNEIKLFRNKNIAIVNGKETLLNGYVVLTGFKDGENWYIPSKVIDIVKSFK